MYLGLTLSVLIISVCIFFGGGGCDIKIKDNYLGQIYLFILKEGICLNFEEEFFGIVLVEQRLCSEI